jgi:hypothetical protein
MYSFAERERRWVRAHPRCGTRRSAAADADADAGVEVRICIDVGRHRALSENVERGSSASARRIRRRAADCVDVGF